MKQNKCRNCVRFNEYYYKSSRMLRPAGAGKCKAFEKIIEGNNAACKGYKERDREFAVELRQNNILDRLLYVFNEINELLLILISDKEEKNSEE